MKVAVIGAAGNIGNALCVRLNENKEVIHAFAKNDVQMIKMVKNLPRLFIPSKNRSSYFDAADCHDVARTVRGEYGGNEKVDSVVYCVGHCPPGGFLDAIKTPLSKFSIEDFNREIDMHICGPLNVFQKFLPVVRDGGHFVFISSAATRLLTMPREQRPPIHIYHHLAAIAAEDALIEGMRMDPEVKKRGIKIDRIMPPAISDSPFHKVEGGPKLKVTVTTAQVIDAIVSSLTAVDHQDVLMI